ncbi:MAG: DUF89 family protein, partial [Candidatus Omnitrophica bacterium]|nr:DUF89 family protein [Candidatus Omnitrophota bacterium]
MKILKTFRKIVKFTAFFFSIYFTLFSSISYAQNVNDRVNAPAYVQVTIPQELGTISNSYFTSVAKSDLDKAPRPSAGLIIHIQDAHGQLAAQKNIDQILEYLVKKYGFQTVFLEGELNGKISPDLLRFFKDETKNEKVANQLLEDGRIEGADVFLLKSKGKVSAYGLESASLYRRNILAYREVVSEKKNSENFLAQLKKQIFSFGSNYFNPELNKFTKEWLEFQDSHTEALKHLMILDEYARKYLKINLREAKKQFDYPQLVRFFSIKDMERNYGREEIKPRIHSDLKRLKKWLAEKKLNPAYAQIFESLVNYSYSSLNPSFPIDVRTFLESFYAEAKLKGFSFSDYYVFMKYLGLLLLAQELESDRLFDEIKKMNVEILKSLAKTPEENSLVRLIRDYFLFKKLLALELTRDEFSEVIEKEKVLTPYILTSRLRMLNNAKIKASIEAPRELGDLFQSAMRFYALAGEREDRMFNNMLSVLDGKPEKRIILITGGFHSHGLETLFRGQGFSFIGVTPRMAEVESNKKYVEQMLAGASTVPAISAGKIPLLEIKRFMGEKDFEFQEQAIQQAIAASLGELMPTDMDKLINDLMAEYTVPSNPPVEIVASPEHYRVGPYQFKENSERLTQHFQDYLGYASRNLKPDQRVFAQQALKKLIAREDFRDLAARAAEEIIYEFIKRITGNPEPLRSLKSMATEVAADELGQMNTSPAYLNNFFLQGKLMIGYAVGGNRATSVTFREQAIQGREALSNYMASLEQLPQISVNQSNSLLQQMNGEPKRVLYFLDNVMENVFDLILIRWLLIRGHEVTLVAKSKEADNDVTLEDLKYLFALPAIKKYMESFVGSDKLRMIASGSAARGTDLRRATPELIEAWKRAEVIISKGEGNRITLEGVNKDVFHLLVAKSTIEVPAHLPKGFGAIELVPATKAASLGAEKKEKQSLVVDSNAVRSLLFQHINSLVTIPTLHVLAHKKVFELFGNKEEPKRVGLMTIAKQFNDDDPLRNLGNLYGAMRTLALQGWVKISGVDEITQYELTEEGWKVVMLAELGYFRETVDAISNMRHYHTYFRGPPTDSSQYALLEFKKLAALSKSRSEIADLLMSPVMVALGMPLFEEQKDGSIKEKDPSFFKVFDKETQTLNLDSIGIGHDRKFLDAAFQLLASKGLAEFVDGCENLVRLTPLGAALKDMVVSYGVTNSYLNFYAKLDDALFVNPEPLKIADDEHIDRVMDIWGSSGSHKPYLKNKKDEGILAMVEKIFNLPLDQQPKGIADMGCGDGKMLAEIVEYIIHHTKRGKHLDTHPLAVVAADHSSKSQGRAKATLKKIAAIPGVSVEVLFGDVTNPGQYDRDIQERFTARGFQVGAKDLLHTQMFLPHERRLQVKTREAARRIIREHLKTVNRDALKKILKISFLPDSENDLLALIERQLTVSYSDRGRLIPGIVAAADLIQFVGRWTRYASRGLIILDLHTPRPEELGADKLAAPAYWGTHWISQHIMPYQEHNLCLLLAGLEPQETVFYPSKSPHTVSLSNYLPSQIAKAASLGSERDQEAQLRGLKGRIKAIEFDLQFFEDLLEVTPFEFETYLESLEAKQISVKPADLKEIGEEIAAVNLEQTLELRQFTESEIKKLKARFNKISANNIFRKKVEEFSERLSTLKGITKEKGIEMMVFVQDHYRKERKLGHGEIAGLLSRKDKRPLRVAVISDWIRGTKRIPFKYLFRVKQVYDAIAASSGSQAAGASLGADENRGGSSNGG